MAYGGELALIVDNPNYDNKLFQRSYTIHNVSLGCGYISGDPENSANIALISKLWLKLYEQKQITTNVRTVSFNDLKTGLLEVKAGHSIGKTVAKFC